MSNQIIHVNGEGDFPIYVKLDGFITRNKTTKSRVYRYLAWCDDNDIHWATPDFRSYRDALIADGLSPNTIASTLATLRSAYHYVMTDNDFRAWLMMQSPTDDFVGAKAFVDETIQRIQNAIDPAQTPLPTVSRQDDADGDFVRFTESQLSQLRDMALSQNNLAGYRDNALITIMAYTGVREAEAVALDVADLRNSLSGYPALRVRKGKGSKQRLIPYGKYESLVMGAVGEYHAHAQISVGAVFRGVKRNGESRNSRLGISSVGYILNQYRLPDVPHFSPHDLRRTYARLMHSQGVPVEGIKANMGHTSIQTTWHYIGLADVENRVP
jgi:site-specific recombinase XerD